MARGFAFVQLIIISLGVFTLHLLGKLNHPTEPLEFIPALASFLGRHGLWLIPLPILWAILGGKLTTSFGKKVTNTAGVILTAILFLIFAVPLFWHLK